MTISGLIGKIPVAANADMMFLAVKDASHAGLNPLKKKRFVMATTPPLSIVILSICFE